MYEPAYLPNPDRENEFLPGLRFLLNHYKPDVQVEENSSEPIMIHNCYELFVCGSTPVSFLVNQKLYHVSEGNALLIKPGDAHACLFRQSCPHSFFCLWIDADQNPPFARLLDSLSEKPLFAFDREDTRILHSLLIKLKHPTHDDCQSVEAAKILFEIVSLLDGGKMPKRAIANLPSPLQAILTDINEHFVKIHHVQKLAQAHSISITTLNRWFRQDLHVSPHDLLESKKLAHAMALLSAGESVTDACTRSGFTECSHFIRRFKMKLGTTPLKFRQCAD